jgi:type I restriction enzyme R subunit
VDAGHAEDIPDQLKKSPALRALYNNLKVNGTSTAGADASDPALDLALQIDETIKRVRPDAWRGVDTRERAVKAALYQILHDVSEVERIFLVIKAQREY